MPAIRSVRVLTLVLAVLLTGSTVWSGGAGAGVSIIADGYHLGFDVAPRIERGRVLVPWRWLADFYGFTVAYDPETQVITTTGNGRTLLLTVGAEQAQANGRTVSLDVAPVIADGRLLVPLRFASEALGLQVAWDEESRTATLTGGKAAPPPVPPLLAEEILSARSRISAPDWGLWGEPYTADNPAHAPVLTQLADAWNKAVPAAHPGLRTLVGYFSGLEIHLADGEARVEPAQICRETGCGGDSEAGYLHLTISRNGAYERALVYAPELAHLMATFPSPKPAN